MMDAQLQLAAEEFARCLQSSSPVRQFQNAKAAYENDPAVLQLRQEFVSISREYQRKQSSNNLTREDIQRVKEAQQRLGSHPLATRYADAQENLLTWLRKSNVAISEVLGFDFATQASPAKRC